MRKPTDFKACALCLFKVLIPTGVIDSGTTMPTRESSSKVVGVTNPNEQTERASRSQSCYQMGFHPKSSILPHMTDLLRSSYVRLTDVLDITRTTKIR